MSMKEESRRRTPRRVLQVPAVLRPAGCAPLAVRSFDVGLSGLCVLSAVTVEVRAPCEVAFKLPSGANVMSSLQLKARIVYSILGSSGFKIGLQFEAVGQEASAALSRYVPATTGTRASPAA